MSGRVIAGVGMRNSCGAAAVVALVRAASKRSGRAVDALAAPTFKAGPRLAAAAAELGVALLLIDDDALAAAQARCVTHSPRAERAVGFASIAEGSALAAAGAEGRLVLPRIVGAAVTCALAESRS